MLCFHERDLLSFLLLLYTFLRRTTSAVKLNWRRKIVVQYVEFTSKGSDNLQLLAACSVMCVDRYLLK